MYFSDLKPSDDLAPTEFYVRGLPHQEDHVRYGDEKMNWITFSDKLFSKGEDLERLNQIFDLFGSYDRKENLLAQSIVREEPQLISEWLKHEKESQYIERIISFFEDPADNDFKEFFLTELRQQCEKMKESDHYKKSKIAKKVLDKYFPVDTKPWYLSTKEEPVDKESLDDSDQAKKTFK